MYPCTCMTPTSELTQKKGKGRRFIYAKLWGEPYPSLPPFGTTPEPCNKWREFSIWEIWITCKTRHSVAIKCSKIHTHGCCMLVIFVCLSLILFHFHMFNLIYFILIYLSYLNLILLIDWCIDWFIRSIFSSLFIHSFIHSFIHNILHS